MTVNKIAFLLFCVMSFQLSAQDLGTSFLRNTWQVNYTNPARLPQAMKVAISLPGAYGNISSPISFNDLITPTATGSLLDIEWAISQLKNNNNAFLNTHIHTFNIGVAFPKFSINFGHTLRSDFAFRFPKALAQLAWQGNASFIGQTLQIAPNVSFNFYNEYALGGTYKHNQWQFGGKLKLLSGVATLSSKRSSFGLNTSTDVYQLTFNGDYIVQTAGFVEFDAEDGMIVNPDLGQNGLLFSNNLGAAFDIGATYQVNEKLNLSASMLDIGGIVWRTIPNIYTASGEASFEGINLISYTQDFSLSFDEKRDSILALFNVAQAQNSFFTSLPTRTYINADYLLNKWLTLGGVLYFESNQLRINSAVSGNATLHLGKIWDIGASYSANTNSIANIGVSSVLNLGTLQFLLMTDNILPVFTPETQRNTNFRLGLNLIFRDKNAEETTKTSAKKNKAYKNAPSVDCPKDF